MPKDRQWSAGYPLCSPLLHQAANISQSEHGGNGERSRESESQCGLVNEGFSLFAREREFASADLLQQIITPPRSSIPVWNLFDFVRVRIVLSRVQGRKDIRDDRDSYSSDGPVQCRYLRRPCLGRLSFAGLRLASRSYASPPFK